jgi:hypothetical protein
VSEHTGGMVALLLDPESAARLPVPDYCGGLPLDELHLTLAFLGDEVTGWTHVVRAAALNVVRAALVDVGASSPVDARAFAHATFNPDRGPAGDRDPCAAYLAGDWVELPLHDTREQRIEQARRSFRPRSTATGPSGAGHGGSAFE